MKSPLEAVNGIGPVYATALRSVGICTPQQLIECVASHGAAGLACSLNHENVTEGVILRWVGSSAVLLKGEADKLSHRSLRLSVAGLVLGVLGFAYGFWKDRASEIAQEAARQRIAQLQASSDEQRDLLNRSRREDWFKRQAARFSGSRCARLGVSLEGDFASFKSTDQFGTAFRSVIYKDARSPPSPLGRSTIIEIALLPAPTSGPYRTGRWGSCTLAAEVRTNDGDRAYRESSNYYCSLRGGLIVIEMPTSLLRSVLESSELTNESVIGFLSGARLEVGNNAIAQAVQKVTFVVDGMRVPAVKTPTQHATRHSESRLFYVDASSFANSFLDHAGRAYDHLAKATPAILAKRDHTGQSLSSEIETALGAADAMGGARTQNHGWCECDDGIDNDGDGFIDYSADPGCANLLDVSEWPPNTREEGREHNFLVTERLNRLFAAEEDQKNRNPSAAP